MTNAEREAQIRYQNTEAPTCPPGHSDIKLLLRLLDEARGEIAQLTSDEDEALEEEGAVRLSLARKRNEIIADLENEIANLKDEIARLQAPPGTSAMDRSRDAYWENYDRNGARIMPTDQRHPIFCVSSVACTIEQAEAEARAKAIEEAAQVVIASGRPDFAGFIDAIRALAKPLSDALSCPIHGSFVLDLDGTRKCNFMGCSWRKPPPL